MSHLLPDVDDLKRSLMAVLAQVRLETTDAVLWHDLKDKTLACLDRADAQTLRSAFQALGKSRHWILDDEWKEFVATSQRELVRKGHSDFLEAVQEMFREAPAHSHLTKQSKRMGPASSNPVAKRQRHIGPVASAIVSKTVRRQNLSLVDAFYLLKTNGVHNQRHAISLDEIVTAGAELVVICNFKMDIPWMWERAPGLQTSRKILIVHGETSDDEQEWGKFISHQGAAERVRFFRPRTPPYGTVHTKMILLFFSTGCRVCVHTANMLSMDWDFKTQGAYVRDFPVLDLSSSDISGRGTREDFKLQLLRYFRHSLSGKEMSDVTEMINRYDFSSAGVALVSSVPGVHRGEAKHYFGHARLRSILEKERFPSDIGDTVAVCQFSSLGSIQRKWLDQEFKQTLFAENRPMTLGSVNEGEIKLIFPTVSQVQDSNEGLQAGASLPVNGKNLHRDHLTSKLHVWDARISGREKAMPHIKTFLRYNASSPESPFWVFLGSFNLSVAAWGRMQGGKKSSSSWDRLNVLSYEIGVLFSANIARPQVHAIDGSIKYHIPCALEREVWVSARQHRRVSLHLSHFESESNGEDNINSEARVVLKIPLPYALPPRKYNRDDTPWTTEFCCIA